MKVATINKIANVNNVYSVSGRRAVQNDTGVDSYVTSPRIALNGGFAQVGLHVSKLFQTSNQPQPNIELKDVVDALLINFTAETPLVLLKLYNKKIPPKDVIETVWMAVRDKDDTTRTNALFFLASFKNIELPKWVAQDLIKLLDSKNAQLRTNAFNVVKVLNGGSGFNELMAAMVQRQDIESFWALNGSSFGDIQRTPDVKKSFISLSKDPSPTVRLTYLKVYEALTEELLRDPVSVYPDEELQSTIVELLKDKNDAVMMQAVEYISNDAYRKSIESNIVRRNINDFILQLFDSKKKIDLKRSAATAIDLTPRYVEAGNVDMSWYGSIQESLADENAEKRSMSAYDIVGEISSDMALDNISSINKTTSKELGILFAARAFNSDGSFADQADELGRKFATLITDKDPKVRMATLLGLSKNIVSDNSTYEMPLMDLILAGERDEKIMAGWVLKKIIGYEFDEVMVSEFVDMFRNKVSEKDHRSILFLLSLLRSQPLGAAEEVFEKMVVDYVNSIEGDKIEIDTGEKIITVPKRSYLKRTEQ